MTTIKFYVDATTDPDHPTLMIEAVGQSPMVFARNITDLQLQYRMKNGMLLDEPVIVGNIREVMVSVTGRSENPDFEKTDVPRYNFRSFSSSAFLRNI